MSQEMIDQCEIFEKAVLEGTADYDIESIIADLARTSDDEFQDLIKMYNKADLDLYKIRLGYALELLNYREIIPDLIKMLDVACAFDGFLIALLLMKFNEDIGGQYFIKLHDEDPREFSYQYLWGICLEDKTDTTKKYAAIFHKLHLLEKENKPPTQS